MLPMSIPEVKSYLSDPTHKKKCTCGSLFKHAYAPKTRINTQGLTVSDCESIQVNFGTFVKLYQHLPLPTFVKNSASAYLHHFNDHSKCGRWCPYSLLHPESERRVPTNEELKKYRCKLQNRDMCEIVKRLIIPFLTSEALLNVNHPFATQINEALDQMLTKFAPKNRVYSDISSLTI